MSERQQRGISGWTHATVRSDPFLKIVLMTLNFALEVPRVCSALILSLGFLPADKPFGFERLTHSYKRNAEGKQVQ